MTLRLGFLLSVVLMAFAGNSLLTRAALAGDLLNPAQFALMRLVSGGLVLAVLALRTGGHVRPSREDLPGALSLLAYVAGFSFAYVKLDAGLGALLLFGFVQITTVSASLLSREALSVPKITGLLIAVGGLVYLLRPGTEAAPLGSASMMAAAGIAWGLYTLLGRGAADPLHRTARNFIAASILAAPLLFFAAGTPPHLAGITLAVLSGAVTSGLGYALWYQVLPALKPLTAGSSQLLVPPLTALLGVVLLAEPLTMTLVTASALILGGVALTFIRPNAAQ